MAETLVNGELELVAVRKTVAVVCKDLRDARRVSILVGVWTGYWKIGRTWLKTIGHGACAIYIYVCKIVELLHLHGRLRKVGLGRGDEFAAQAAYVNAFDHGVFGGLPLETEIEILGIRRAEVRIGKIRERNRARLSKAQNKWIIWIR